MPDDGQIYDVIVVGAGVIGLSSALFCRKAGLNVLLLEQFPFPHSRGSSHGCSRITRKSYVESPVISEMMQEAHQLWNLLEMETGTELFRKIGCLYVEAQPAKKLRAIASVNDRLGYQYNLLDESALKDRFGASLDFKGYNGLFDHEGGLLKADVCCRTILDLYKSLGGKFHDLTPIEKILPGLPVKVVSKSGTTFRARKLIVSAGPWSKGLLKQISLDLPLSSETATVMFWKAKTNSFGPETFPCFYDVTTGVYALPAFEYPGLVKLVQQCTNVPDRDPDTRDSNCPTVEELMKVYAPYMNEHFPNLEIPPAIVERCMCTRTPDDMWIIDRHQKHDNIVVLAGFSGHGFKAGPLIGKIASQLVRGIPSRYDLSPFSIRRFTPMAQL